jgi:uncharacterized protein (TIGR03084 family)
MTVLDEVLTDLIVEIGLLDAVLEPLTEDQWRTPTPAIGWDVATQVAHLAWTDHAALAAIADGESWRVILAAAQGSDWFVDRAALAGAAVPSSRLLESWRRSREALVAALRRVPSGERIGWFGQSMVPSTMATGRFMEIWAHGLDIREAIGVPVELSDRIRHVAYLGVRTRDLAFTIHGLRPPDEEIRVELIAPSGATWSWGPPSAAQRVSGPAGDFCRLVTQRVHRDDTALLVTGSDADQWLAIAQAYAGPPGLGRQPRS